MTAKIRAEQPGDAEGIRAVLLDAFEPDSEARLVDALRAAEAMTVSLVDEIEGKIVGHIAFSRVSIESNPSALECHGLAPLSAFRVRTLSSASLDDASGAVENHQTFRIFEDE